MRTFREENIKALNEAIQGDEYDDLSQVENETGGQHGGIDPVAVQFINMYLNDLGGEQLEIGVGSGAYFWNEFITHIIEPSVPMIDLFKKRHSETSTHYTKMENLNSDNCVHGVIECLPDDWKDKFTGCLFTNGIFQVRSDYEGFIEVNRVLKKGGTFVFNIYEDDTQDIICGRVLGSQNYIRVLKEFGFSLIGLKENVGVKGITYMAFRKVKDFDLRDLRKVQLVPINRSEKIYKVNNLNPNRDWAML